MPSVSVSGRVRGLAPAFKPLVGSTPRPQGRRRTRGLLLGWCAPGPGQSDPSRVARPGRLSRTKGLPRGWRRSGPGDQLLGGRSRFLRLPRDLPRGRPRGWRRTARVGRLTIDRWAATNRPRGLPRGQGCPARGDLAMDVPREWACHPVVGRPEVGRPEVGRSAVGVRRRVGGSCPGSDSRRQHRRQPQ